MNTKNLPQDPVFSKYCTQDLEEYSDSFSLDTNVQDCLILSSAAICGNGIDHLLDGYSWAIVARITNNVLDIKTMKIAADEHLRLREQHGTARQFGLFSGHLPTWKKLLLGRIPQLLKTGRAIERQTAHQPIYYPRLSQVLFCSAYTYPSYKINWNGELCLQPAIPYIRNEIPELHYTCMHPQYDNNQEQILTYSFLHSKFFRKTKVWFYSFGENPDADPAPIEYTIKDRIALHMFGFTENYFILFTTSFVLQNCGSCAVSCGSPMLRVLDDEFYGDLLIHFIPRNINDKTRKPFVVNTKQQGFVYHTINCFESGNFIIIDAFVSKLNASRESSQFELNSNHPVFDNDGDAFRYEIYKDPNHPTKAEIRSKLIAVQLDSSIDFHCVDSRLQGQPYTKWYMISHRRERSLDGSIEKIISTMSSFFVDPPKHDPLDFDPNTTLANYTESSFWSNSDKVYLRTPLYVPGETSDDDRILCWCYEVVDDSLVASLLIFTTSLQFIKRIDMNQSIPYSIHSSIALREL